MRKRLGWVLFLAVVAAVAAGALLFWSWKSQASSWESGLLVQFGSTLVLFVPLAIVGRIIERRLDTVGVRQQQIAESQEKTASDVAQLAQDVAQTQSELRLTREELSTIVRERLSTMRNTDSTLFNDVGQTPSRQNILDSLARAESLGLIPDQGCRVSLFHTDLYLRFKTGFKSFTTIRPSDQKPETLILTLENTAADRVSSHRWNDSETASDIGVRIAEMMQAAGSYPGDNIFDAGKIFEDLAMLLKLVHESATGGSIEPLRHIIEFCPPQWAIGDRGIYSTDRPYSITANRLMESDWGRHMNEKTWLDQPSFSEAHSTACALYEAGKLAIKPPEYVEPTPF